MGVIRSFDIKRLKPFHRDGNRMPKPAPEKTDELATLDPDLKPDEQSYVSHYLNYADVLLREDKENEETGETPESPPGNIIKLPKVTEPEPTEQKSKKNDENAA